MASRLAEGGGCSGAGSAGQCGIAGRVRVAFTTASAAVDGPIIGANRGAVSRMRGVRALMSCLTLVAVQILAENAYACARGVCVALSSQCISSRATLVGARDSITRGRVALLSAVRTCAHEFVGDRGCVGAWEATGRVLAAHTRVEARIVAVASSLVRGRRDVSSPNSCSSTVFAFERSGLTDDRTDGFTESVHDLNVCLLL